MTVMITFSGVALPELHAGKFNETRSACDLGIQLFQSPESARSCAGVCGTSPKRDSHCGTASCGTNAILVKSFSELSKIPGCNLHVLGQDKKRMNAGLSSLGAKRHRGVPMALLSSPKRQRSSRKACKGGGKQGSTRCKNGRAWAKQGGRIWGAAS